MLLQPEETLAVSSADPCLINLADFAVATNVLGPGRRAIIWVQGCPRRCPKCITPHMQRFDVEQEWITPDALAKRVLASGAIEGVTFVGGEPFSHARQLVQLMLSLQASSTPATLNPLSVVTYTGHILERIQALDRPDWNELLKVTDLLIDGEYLDAQSTDLLWRGSANQRLHFLSSRYAVLEPLVVAARGRVLEVGVDVRGRLRIIGIPQPGFFDQLTERLAARGVQLKFD